MTQGSQVGGGSNQTTPAPLLSHEPSQAKEATDLKTMHTFFDLITGVGNYPFPFPIPKSTHLCALFPGRNPGSAPVTLHTEGNYLYGD